MKKPVLLIMLMLCAWLSRAQQPVIGGDVLLCPDTNGTASVTNDAAYTAYQWYVRLAGENLFAPVEGQTSDSFTYDATTYLGSDIKVEVTQGDVTYESNSLFIDGYAFLQMYVSTEFIGNAYYSNNAEYYICGGGSIVNTVEGPYTVIQWYKDGVAIEGATDASFAIDSPGIYSVTGSSDICPGLPESTFEFVVTWDETCAPQPGDDDPIPGDDEDIVIVIPVPGDGEIIIDPIPGEDNGDINPDPDGNYPGDDDGDVSIDPVPGDDIVIVIPGDEDGEIITDPAPGDDNGDINPDPDGNYPGDDDGDVSIDPVPGDDIVIVIPGDEDGEIIIDPAPGDGDNNPDPDGNNPGNDNGEVTILPIDPDGVNLYPNPAVYELNIGFDNINITIDSYEVIDLAGKTLMSGNATSGSKIDISDLARGTYFVKVTSKQSQVSKRFIKQ